MRRNERKKSGEDREGEHLITEESREGVGGEGDKKREEIEITKEKEGRVGRGTLFKGSLDLYGFRIKYMKKFSFLKCQTSLL